MPISHDFKSAVIQSSDGTDIFANAVGVPSNPPIVFVHGYSFSAHVFDDLFLDERLLSRYYMVAYDLRGHGRSGKPTTAEAYASKFFADDFAAVIKHFNVKAPLYAGWSYGGSIVTDIFSYLPPETISGVLSIAAIPSFEYFVQTPLAAQLLPLFAEDDVTVNMNAKAEFVDACFNDASSLPIKTKWSMMGAAAIQPPVASKLLLARSQDATKLFEAGAAGPPYLALSGSSEKLLFNDVMTQKLGEHFTELETYEIQGGSHTPFIDSKEEFIDVLIYFADKVLKHINLGASS